ncbi:MAG: DUF4290 domain-containing protein [Muribaculaceae bacterium]|nr:DUF4290 domain-containing protein [Muribaculaceae bacterium]
MLTYNNHLPPVVLPEYGRNIQNMLARCLEIEDRAERTLCARSIVDAMTVLFPQQGDQKSNRLRLWEHLYLMSDFKLDVDVPFEIKRPEEFDTHPDRVAPGSGVAKRRVYGCLLELMVEEAAKMEPDERRFELIVLLANQMKKQLLAVTPDGVDDERVFRDLYEMSGGAIKLTPDDVRLCEYNIVPVQGKKKRKK